MALVLFFLTISVVNALRDTSSPESQNVKMNKNADSFWTKCRSSKCNDQEYQLSGDLDEVSKFQNCQVDEGNPVEINGVTKCEETCTISFGGQSKEVKVLRDSGEGKQKCTPQKGQFHEFCHDECCLPKCSGQSYRVKDVKGKYKLQDCQLKGTKSFKKTGYVMRLCEETCTASDSKQTVKVWRNSAAHMWFHVSPECDVQVLGFEATATDFVKQLEVDALKLTSGNYHHLPMMKPHKVKDFLQKVGEEVLKPEFKKHRYSQEVTATQNAVIIGDLHGQLFNLIAYLVRIKRTFKDKGFKTLAGSRLFYCDPGFQYVFLGDYLDRGERGLELLLLVLSYKALCPQGIILLQGNHEDSKNVYMDVWGTYGFAKELRYKLDGYVKTADVGKVVELLPFAAVAPGNFMALHGGISPELRDRCSGKAGRFSECLDYPTGITTVWTDFHDGFGFTASQRGRGIYKFGMDVAEKFLKSNDLIGIFRGHEQLQKGYVRKQSNGHFVATVFSAADYVGLFCVNDGKVPKFDDQEMFSEPGEGNHGAIVIADLTAGTVSDIRTSADGNRLVAAKFTGAECRKGFSLMESERNKATLESFMQKNHQNLALGNHSCSLGQAEKDSLKEEVRKILTTSENKEFEARKLIDLQGEALNHGESAEICESIAKDKLTLEVYNELKGPDEEILESDIKIREHQLESDDAAVDGQ